MGWTRRVSHAGLAPEEGPRMFWPRGLKVGAPTPTRRSAALQNSHFNPSTLLFVTLGSSLWVQSADKAASAGCRTGNLGTGVLAQVLIQALKAPPTTGAFVVRVYFGQIKLRREVKGWGVFTISSSRMATWSFFTGLHESGSCSGAPLLAPPSPCLLLYVWMPLRRDVKVCGPQSARSGKNGSQF